MLLGTHNMGGYGWIKHEKGELKNGGKGQIGGKKCSITLLLIASTTTMGKYNVRDIPQSWLFFFWGQPGHHISSRNQTFPRRATVNHRCCLVIGFVQNPIILKNQMEPLMWFWEPWFNGYWFLNKTQLFSNIWWEPLMRFWEQFFEFVKPFSSNTFAKP